MSAAMEPAPGDNLPPLDLAEVLAPDLLAAQVSRAIADLAPRAAELLESFSRFDAATAGAGIGNDETAARAGDLARMITDHRRTIEGRRETIKRPLLEGSRIVDSLVKREYSDPLDEAARVIRARLSQFVDRKAAQARAEQDRAARQAAAEAARLAEAGAIASAIEKEADAAAMAAAPIAPAVLRSDLGTTISSRRGPLKVRIVDPAKVPREFLMVNEPALLAAAKGDKALAEGERRIPGVEFYRESQASIR
jgi:hypothetical protein